MKTQDSVIYHCVRCGRVIHTEREPGPPQCCGQDMVETAETAGKGGERAEKASTSAAKDPPTRKGRQKPR